MKAGLGFCLLPLCVGVTKSLVVLCQSVSSASIGFLPVAGWAFIGGVGVWVVLFCLLPHPGRLYVLGHELTHALWGLLMGAKVSRLRVTKSGGSVHVSRSNIFITLAPYFFPFYTVLLLLIYLLVALFVDMRPYTLFWWGFLGASWAFHVSFTLKSLLSNQPDIAQYGYLLSLSFIYLLHVLGLALALAVVSGVGLGSFFDQIVQNVFFAFREGVAFLVAGIGYLHDRFAPP